MGAEYAVSFRMRLAGGNSRGKESLPALVLFYEVSVGGGVTDRLISFSLFLFTSCLKRIKLR